MKRLFFLPLLLVLISCTCVRAQRMLDSEYVSAMVDQIYEKVKKSHPASFRAEGLAAIEAARTQVQGKVKEAVDGRDSIAYYEFAKLVSPIQNATQCGHLILEPHFDSLASISLRENYFPIQMMPVDSGRLWVLKKGLRTATDSIPAGSFVLNIDGHSPSELIENMSHFTGLNDQGNNYATKVMMGWAFSLGYQRYYGKKDSIVIQFDENHFAPSKQVLRPTHRPYKDPKKAVTDINKTLKFNLSDDGETGILSIRSFSTRKFNNGNYYKYLRGVFDSLNTGGTDQLIIDIRGNTGGSSSRISYLFSFLTNQRFQFASRAEMTGPTRAPAGETGKDRRNRENGAVSKKERRIQKRLTKFLKPQKAKRHYGGQVIVLIDEVSFSASGMFARYVQGYRRGILMGSTAGASANITYGASQEKGKTLIGPQENFRLRVNSIMLEIPNPVPGNVVPDIHVPMTVKGLKLGKDEVMEEALLVIGKKGI